MSLDGLRAWIGEVERKLGVRSRVFLVLVAVAIGGAGAGIYLALDAGDKAASEEDVQALQERLEAQTGAGAEGEVTGLTQLESEIDALRDELDELRGEGATPAPGAGKDGASNEGSSGATPEATGPTSATDGAASAEELKELAEGAADEAK